MNVVRIGITDDTQPEDMDRYFSTLYKYRQPHVLVFDTTQCNNVSLRRMLGMKKVLNKHRWYSKNYIDHSVILVKNSFTKRVLNVALKIIKTDKVKVNISLDNDVFKLLFEGSPSTATIFQIKHFSFREIDENNNREYSALRSNINIQNLMRGHD